MSTGPQQSPAARPAENVEVVATQTQDGAFEIQVTRNLSTGSTPVGSVNAGAPQLGSLAGQSSQSPDDHAGTGFGRGLAEAVIVAPTIWRLRGRNWKGIVAATLVASVVAGVVIVLVSAPSPPPVGEVVVPEQPESTPASTREERRFTVYQGGIYQTQQPVARTARVNFDSIRDQPDTTDSDGSGSADEPVEVVLPDEPAIDGEIPLIPPAEAPEQAVADELAAEVVEQLREIPVQE